MWGRCGFKLNSWDPTRKKGGRVVEFKEGGAFLLPIGRKTLQSGESSEKR